MAEDILATHAASQPGKPAVCGPDRTLSFEQLNRRANRAAWALAGLGAEPGDRIATMAFNCVAGYELSAASRKLGLISVPINFRLRSSEVAHVISDSGTRIVLAGAEHVKVVGEALASAGGTVARIALAGTPPQGWHGYEALMVAAGDGEPSSSGQRATGASMIYTSGTTGHPKGAFRGRGVPIEVTMQMVELFGLSRSDVHLVAGPGYHSAVGFFSSLTLTLGGTVVVMPKFDPESALRLIQEHRVTTTFMAPTLLQRICDLPEAARAGYDFSSLRAIILGAAPCPFELKERALAMFGQKLWEFYGATETGINTVLRPADQLRKPGSCGVLAPGQELLLLDDDGRQVPDGTPGQVWVRNPHLAEYYKNEDATARAMRDGFFTVGDVAYRDEDGFYYICDRRIDMIISGGVNIYPAEVEAALHAHPAVRDVAVVGVPDAHWGESVKAVVQLHVPGSAGQEELLRFAAGRLADYKKPRSVEFVAELPRDAAGKLLKKQIREPYWAGEARTI